MGAGRGGQARRQAGRRAGGRIRTGGEQAGGRRAEKQRRTGNNTRQCRQGWELAGNRWTAGWSRKAIRGRKAIPGRRTAMTGRKTRPGRTATTGRKPGEAQERPARTLSRPLSGANEAADGERQCLRKFHLELSLLISNLPSVGVLSAMEMSAYFSSVPGTLLGIMR